jgi:hypothetical protein
MVLVISDNVWGLGSTGAYATSAPLIGTKSKLCPDCDAGSIQALTQERAFPQEPALTVNNTLDEPTAEVPQGQIVYTQVGDGGPGTIISGVPIKTAGPAPWEQQPSADGGSNTVPTADGGAKKDEPTLGRVETIIAGLGILVILGAGLWYGVKTLVK